MGHQLCAAGYQILFGGMCVTVWSAPNYCCRCGNTASILDVDDDLQAAGCLPLPRHFNTFTEAPSGGPPDSVHYGDGTDHSNPATWGPQRFIDQDAESSLPSYFS